MVLAKEGWGVDVRTEFVKERFEIVRQHQTAATARMQYQTGPAIPMANMLSYPQLQPPQMRYQDQFTAPPAFVQYCGTPSPGLSLNDGMLPSPDGENAQQGFNMSQIKAHQLGTPVASVTSSPIPHPSYREAAPSMKPWASAQFKREAVSASLAQFPMDCASRAQMPQDGNNSTSADMGGWSTNAGLMRQFQPMALLTMQNQADIPASGATDMPTQSSKHRRPSDAPRSAEPEQKAFPPLSVNINVPTASDTPATPTQLTTPALNTPTPVSATSQGPAKARLDIQMVTKEEILVTELNGDTRKLSGVYISLQGSGLVVRVDEQGVLQQGFGLMRFMDLWEEKRGKIDRQATEKWFREKLNAMRHGAAARI